MQSLPTVTTRMTSLTIRRLDEKTKARLRVRAAQRGRSLAIRSRFRRLGGVGLPLPARGVARVDPGKA
jgi:hypothetical protein